MGQETARSGISDVLKDAEAFGSVLKLLLLCAYGLNLRIQWPEATGGFHRIY